MMLDVNTVVSALTPAFAVGVGIQHFNELLDAGFSRIAADDNNTKKLCMGLSSLFLGLVATTLLKLRILQLLAQVPSPGEAFKLVDIVVTALIISTGTEGINSIVKFMGYAKDQRKAAAGSSEQAAGITAIKMVNR